MEKLRPSLETLGVLGYMQPYLAAHRVLDIPGAGDAGGAGGEAGEAGGRLGLWVAVQSALRTKREAELATAALRGFRVGRTLGAAHRISAQLAQFRGGWRPSTPPASTRAGKAALTVPFSGADVRRFELLPLTLRLVLMASARNLFGKAIGPQVPPPEQVPRRDIGAQVKRSRGQVGLLLGELVSRLGLRRTPLPQERCEEWVERTLAKTFTSTDPAREVLLLLLLLMALI